jgi:hypothetical protein
MEREEESIALWIEHDWVVKLRRWTNRTGQAMQQYLQEQLWDALPRFRWGGLPPDTGKPRHYISVENGAGWLGAAVADLRRLQAALGVRRDVAKAAPAPARFEELHASGLIEKRVIEDHAKAMLEPRTPKQLSDAIGSAKELTEATLRASLSQLSVSWDRRDDLPKLTKMWRAAIDQLAQPDPTGREALEKALRALANVVTFVAEWRNLYGSGHGKSKYPPGLAPRHARLAADSAATCVRFIVTTMDDLQLLPPP